MYLELENIYRIFDKYKFILYKKEINNNKILLEFCRVENVIDKFSILLTENNIETIIPLKKNNIAFKNSNYNFKNTFNYLKYGI